MKILIATDGSEFSRAAIERGCGMLRADSSVEFRIISVYEQIVPMAAEPFAISAQYFQEMMEVARKQCVSFVEDAKQSVISAVGDAEVAIDTEVRLGAPVTVIIDEATDWGADLILLGSHGRGFWGRLTLGSVSDAVMHHAPCSVMIARKD